MIYSEHISPSLEAILIKQRFFNQPEEFISEIMQDPSWTGDGIGNDDGTLKYTFEHKMGDDVKNIQVATLESLVSEHPETLEQLWSPIMQIRREIEIATQQSRYTISLEVPSVVPHLYKPNNFGLNVTNVSYTVNGEGIEPKRTFTRPITDLGHSEKEILTHAQRYQFGTDTRFEKDLPEKIDIFRVINNFFEEYNLRTFRPPQLVPA